MKNYRKTKFIICDVTEVYEGITFGESWNGWEVPYFTEEVCYKIIKGQCKDSCIEFNQYYFDFDEKGNIKATNFTEEEDYIIKPITIENEKYYSLGGMIWIWEEYQE